MKAAIVITNYNYGRYVGEAIDSALAQTWRDLQVVVVDDGSTDDSWQRIGRYGDRIVARRIANSGQGGASNVGFALTDAPIVLFLDSDDLLDPDCLEVCMPLFRADVAKVQFRMRRIDADSRPLGGVVPYLMHEGDVRPVMRTFGHYAGPPSSGNVYRRSAIERYFPMPPDAWRHAADTVPFLLSAYNGRVANAPRPLGSYRLHRSQSTPGVFGNVRRSLADVLRVECARRDAALALLAQRDGIVPGGNYLPLPWSVRTRALSWRLEPERHPYPDDTPWRLLRLQGRTLQAWPGYRPLEKLLALGWVAATALLPRPLVGRLAQANTSASVRTWVRRMTRRTA